MNPGAPQPKGGSLVKNAAAAALFIAVAFLVYYPSLNGPFVFDDIYYIAENPGIALNSFSADGLVAAAATRRPLTTLSFALNHLAGGYDTLGFHAVNTLIHALTAFFFLLLARLTLSLGGQAKNSGKAAFIASLVFLCHPLATQSVSYISQRANSMCAMFFILSLFLFAKSRTADGKTAARLFFSGCAMSGVLAVMSKENAAALPFFIFWYEWIFFRKGDEVWLKNLALPIIWGLLLVLIPLAAVAGRGSVHPGFLAAACVLTPAACYLALSRLGKTLGGREKSRALRAIEAALTASILIVAVSVWVQAGPWATIMHEYKNIAPITCHQRLLTEARVVLCYLFLYILPLPAFLSLGHDLKVSTGLFSPLSTIFALAVIAWLCAYAVKARKKRPLLAFAILMYFGNLALESTVYPLHLIFEHRAYLPMVFLALPPVSWALERFPRSSPRALLLLAAILGLFTFQRNLVWADDLALWEDAAKKAPNDALAQNNMGIALFGRGRTSEAVARFTAAMQADPALMDAPYNLGLLYREKGRPKMAETMFRRALAIRDDYVFAHNDLGLTLMDLGRDREAEIHFKKALAWNPYFAKAMNNLGTLMLNRGNRADAAKQFRAALDAAPGFVRARINLGIVLLQQGKADEAVIVLEKAVEDDPGNAETKAQLGNALLHSGDAAGAVKLLRKAVALDPENADARNSLAVALTSQGRNLEAIVEYRAALTRMEREAADMASRAAPGSGSKVFMRIERAAVHKNLALALSRMKQMEKARRELEQAVLLTPSDLDARLGLGSVLASLGLDEQAREIFSAATGDFPESPKAFRDLGRILIHMDRPREALTAFSRAAVLAPRDTGIYRDIELARDLMDNKQLETN